ncbi:hypothetical protein [Leifsonia sp. Leaf264]|uniref:hypothetical protein n=1 Tax=Leifsonia sp. Leaf264 TaxID=1736314 RepID=UPI0006F74A05|nr:hypothetical protein [Leifsonia sp. Leaf264]KQO98320.1 hypothetical protein ASF30_09680 [Leifsonia sp. Leaf264]
MAIATISDTTLDDQGGYKSGLALGNVLRPIRELIAAPELNDAVAEIDRALDEELTSKYERGFAAGISKVLTVLADRGVTLTTAELGLTDEELASVDKIRLHDLILSVHRNSALRGRQ